MSEDIRKYPLKSGEIIGEDGETQNIVTILGGGEPVSEKVHDIRRYPPRGGRVLGRDGKEYSLVELLKNAAGGGGGGGDDVTWPVPGTPQKFPPTEHNHDDRYYTKDEIDGSINHVASTLQGKVMAKPDDQPDYLQNKVDGSTIAVEGSELKAKSLDGLALTPTQINALLAGGSENIPTQINDIYMTLAALSAGMRYLGKFETKSDLESVTVMDNGDLAVVLADESRSGARSMYVYNDSLGIWDFIGAFEFADAFTSLSDTPNAYDDGKILRSGASGLYFDTIKYGEIDEKPSSTITQIDDAVSKRHEHANKDKLDKVSEDASGVFTYNGEQYVRMSDIPALQAKQHLFAYRSGNQELTAGMDCVFNARLSGDIPYDTDTGIFTLEAGKTYRVMVEGSLYTSGYVILQLVDAETNSIVNSIARGIWMSVNPSNTNWHESSAGPLKTYVTPAATRGYKIRATSVSGESSLRSNYMSLEVLEI